MIQRIQTVYLALAAILLVVPTVFNLNWASVDSEEGSFALSSVSINRTGVVTEVESGAFLIAAAIGLALLITVYAILQFKNRKFQMKLVQGAMALQVVVPALVFFYASKMADMAESDAVSYSPLLATFVVNIILCILAYRGIKKDEALVRSADRLR